MSERKEKKEKFQSQDSAGRKWLAPLIIAIVIIAGAAGWLMVGQQATGGHTSVSAEQNGTLRFAKSDLADGKARFYRFEGERGPIDFFLVKSGDGVIRAAFDTCDVCYKERKGYRQQGDYMVCNNCDQQFRTDLVNVVKGGCNPAPLNRQQVGGDVIITKADIELGARYFLN